MGLGGLCPREVVPCNCQKAAPSGKEKNGVEANSRLLELRQCWLLRIPQGAVIGATATLDHSHLITNEEFGARSLKTWPISQRSSLSISVECAETLTKCGQS